MFVSEASSLLPLAGLMTELNNAVQTNTVRLVRFTIFSMYVVALECGPRILRLELKHNV